MKADNFNEALSMIDSAKAITSVLSICLNDFNETGGGPTKQLLSQAMDGVSLLLKQADEKLWLDLKESET